MRRRVKGKAQERAGEPPGDPESLAAFVPRYLEAIRVRHYSEATIQVNRQYLGYFVEWCAERGLVRPSEVTRPILQRYQGWLYHYRKANGRPLSLVTQCDRLQSLRSFFKWLTRENYLLYNPASELELPRPEKRLPRNVLNAGEAEKVLNQPELSDPLGLRDRAILETFYSTGMRRRELINLDLFDVDPQRGVVMIRLGKGKKDRLVPIGQAALAWLEKYLAEARPQLVVDPHHQSLFLSAEGNRLDPNHLSRIVRGYIQAAEIGKQGSCHLLRHTMATLMLENGADIRFIQQMLGHTKLSTTQVYTQVSIAKLKQIHAATHPSAQLERRNESGRDPAPEVPDEGGTDRLSE